MNIKRNIIFTTENRKKDGKLIIDNVPIRMRVIYGGKRIDFTTGYRIDSSKWDSNKQRVKNGCTNKLKQSASEINSDLSLYETDIQNIFKEFELLEMMPTQEQIRVRFNSKRQGLNFEDMEDSKEPQKSLIDVFDEFVKESGTQNDWTDSTYKKFGSVRNHLKDFDGHIVFEDFSENKLIDYVNFLRTQKNMRNSTIEKQVKFFIISSSLSLLKIPSKNVS